MDCSAHAHSCLPSCLTYHILQFRTCCSDPRPLNIRSSLPTLSFPWYLSPLWHLELNWEALLINPTLLRMYPLHIHCALASSAPVLLIRLHGQEYYELLLSRRGEKCWLKFTSMNTSVSAYNTKRN